MGPNQLGWLECAVAALAETGLTGDELVNAVLVVNGHVRSMAPFSMSPAEGGLTGEQWGSALLDLLREHSDRFPALTTAIAAGAFGPSSDDDDALEFGLQRVLDGIEVLVNERAGTAGT